MADETKCPTCGGPCIVTVDQPRKIKCHYYKSTAEAGARRREREAAIATRRKIMDEVYQDEFDAGERMAVEDWIDDHYPATGVKE